MWFKGQVIIGGDLNTLLKYGQRDPNWAKGIPSSYLKNEWAEVVKLIKIYLTCERRYNVVFIYHMIFIFHVAGVKTLMLV